MVLCDNILTEDIITDCANASELGFRKKAWIFNYEEIEFPLSESIGQFPVFSMKTGKRGYIVTQLGKNPYEGTNTALVVGPYRNSFTNQVKLYIPDNVNSARLVDSIATGKFVVCLDNGFGGIRVYGYNNGLTAIECTQTPYSEETDGGWVVTLEETKAKTSRIHFSASTKEQLDALCKEVV